MASRQQQQGRIRTASTSSQDSVKAAPAPGRFACFCSKWRILHWALFLALVAAVGVATYYFVAHQDDRRFEEAVR